MNFFAIVSFMALFSAYLILHVEQNSYLIDTINQLKLSKQQDYLLEGFLYHSIAYYKKFGKKIKLPHETNISFKKFDEQYNLKFKYKKVSKKIIEIRVKVLIGGKIRVVICNLKSVDKSHKILSIEKS